MKAIKTLQDPYTKEQRDMAGWFFRNSGKIHSIALDIRNAFYPGSVTDNAVPSRHRIVFYPRYECAAQATVVEYMDTSGNMGAVTVIFSGNLPAGPLRFSGENGITVDLSKAPETEWSKMITDCLGFYRIVVGACKAHPLNDEYSNMDLSLAFSANGLEVVSADGDTMTFKDGTVAGGIKCLTPVSGGGNILLPAIDLVHRTLDKLGNTPLFLMNHPCLMSTVEAPCIYYEEEAWGQYKVGNKLIRVTEVAGFHRVSYPES